MRGAPLLRALIVFLVILSLGYPLRKLTQSNAAQTEREVPVASAEEQVNAVGLQLAFTTVPRSVRVLHLGEEVWKADSPSTEINAELMIPFPKEGVDLQFEVEWPAEPLCAMKVSLTDPEGNTHEKSVWGNGSVTEVLTFP